MPKQTKLTLAQVFLLAWMDAKRREGERSGVYGVGIARTNRVPPCVEYGRRMLHEPQGVSMAAVIGLARRGLAIASGPYNAFYGITDAGRAALSRCADLVEQLTTAPEHGGDE